MSLGRRHRERAADHAPAAGAPPGEEPRKGETAIWRRGAVRARRRRYTAALSIAALLAIAVAFEIVYGQAPLYTGDQHTDLLHGLAHAGVGLLELDWQAQTIDPTPISSLLVSAAAALEAEWLMLLFHALLIGAYGLALFGIGATLFRVERTTHRLVLLATLLFVHSWLAFEVQGGLPDDIRSLVTEGLAGQYAPGLTFQPSLFGVLLIVSLFLYVRNLPVAAVATAGAAAIFDPAYLLGAGVLCGAYLADTFFRTGARAIVARGAAVAAVTLLPVALFALIAFTPSSPAIHEAAQNVLVDFRLPHHAKPEVWFAPDDAFRLGLVAVGLALSWRSVLFPVLALAVAASALLTALQLVTGSETLALLFPWRLSVFLVPVSAAILLAAATKLLFAGAGALERAASRLSVARAARLATGARTGARALAGLVIAVSVLVGGERIGRLDPEPKASPIGRMVAAQRLPGELYLIPPQAYELRIDAAIPVYVDYKTHPYEDGQVLEWRRRLGEATRVYAGGSLRCDRLEPLARSAGITHVIVKAPTRGRCDFLRKSYAVDGYSVFAVEPPRGKRA